MKKLTALLTGIIMILCLAACGGSSYSGTSGSSDDNSPASDSGSASAGADSSQTESPENSTGSGSTLVVYFSATGNTEEAAGYIAEITGGDLFELEPADPYTDEDLNYGNEDSRVSREHEDEALRDVELTADTVDNWSEYDTVFIGYPKMEQGYICV